MNLGQTLLDKLNAMQQPENSKSFSLKPAGETGDFVITQEVDNISLRVEIEESDKFSYMVKTIDVTRSEPAPTKPLQEVLLRQANEIERRISYLLESFRLVELDEVNGSAQVRSTAPYQKDEERLYYEILLQHGNNLRFARYRKERRSEQREIVPSHLTQEIFERLINDLAAVIRLS